ncbi:THO complex subunit 1 transcription elongation factor-domain-containing protein [Dioszegia hungarica]|uniref:THO complex subunit 1 transcription elongation factor-domain-containing protein n=1 Tax=Dioszegia hungarica TaxID=4972 RepID=A0AA38HCE4_9TREE|nr:THO complex subunit 1 transcription elongation factor-domain-containing protein [Dioszegia hungarica]KAI9638858.1 THO complex subunit 1 transcription elongation factor-domain-containing protein [Dioszegia hungarica]
MASTLHPQLQAGLNSLLGPGALTDPGTLDPGYVSSLTSKVEAIWRPVFEAYGDGLGSASSSTASANEKRIDMVRTVLELVGKDVVLAPLMDGELPEPETNDTGGQEAFLGALSYRLDLILTLYEVVYASMPDSLSLEPGKLFIPLLEELIELLSVEIWRNLWKYIETRSKRFTKDMPASRGKALPLLRTLNSFLRFLPRTPEDLVFRGRIHQFASSVISVADKSAVNLRGDYSDIQTTWGAEEEKDVAKGEGDGDVEMKEETGKKEDTKETKTSEEEPDFYSTLWSIQQYFSNPSTLDGPPTGSPPVSGFEQFKQKTDFLLPKLFEQTQNEKATSSTESSTSPSQSSRKRKREDGGDPTDSAVTADPLPASTSTSANAFFHPRYLTGRRLFSHELADPSFRRQILVQYTILFQFLLNLTPSLVSKQAYTGGISKTFVLGPEDQEWVRKKAMGIREELRKMGRDGKTFESTLMSVIHRERHYAQWKNEACPESVFDVPPMKEDFVKEAAEGWKRHCEPPARFPFKLGSRPLTLLWRNGFEGIDQLKGWKRSTTFYGLEEELKAMEEGIEDDKAMGREQSEDDQAASQELRTKNTWRGLRLASHVGLRFFQACREKRDLHTLVDAMKAEEEGKGLRSAPRPGGREGTEDRTEDEATKEMEESVKAEAAVEEVEEARALTPPLEDKKVKDEKVEVVGADVEMAS